MSPTPRPTEPQLTPEGLTDEDQRAAGGEEASTGGAGEGKSADERRFGNLTENLTTRWNVESR